MSDFDDVQQLETPLADGWGITSDGTHLVVGDSSERLTWVDPAAGMKRVRQVAVKGERRTLRRRRLAGGRASLARGGVGVGRRPVASRVGCSCQP